MHNEGTFSLSEGIRKPPIIVKQKVEKKKENPLCLTGLPKLGKNNAEAQRRGDNLLE